MKIRVDRALCEGLGNCVVAGPTVLQLDKEGKAVVTDPSSVNDDKLVEIAESCPLNAIIIEDDKGNQVYP
jgi:ferredoxin